MKQDVKLFISSCIVCQQTKNNHRKSSGLLCPLPMPARKARGVHRFTSGALHCCHCGQDIYGDCWQNPWHATQPHPRPRSPVRESPLARTIQAKRYQTQDEHGVSPPYGGPDRGDESRNRATPPSFCPPKTDNMGTFPPMAGVVVQHIHPLRYRQVTI